MYGYIYLTTNLVNGKKYIGQHKSSEFDENYKGSGKILKQAFKKYGWDNFKTELLVECNSFKELNQIEKDLIKETNAVYSDEYYNVAYGGSNNPGHPLSEKERQHRSQYYKNLWNDKSYRLKMSKMLHEKQKDGKSWMIGKKHSEETKSKMSKSRQGKLHPMYGKHHSEETRKLLSLNHVDMSGKNNPFYGKKHTEESKQKMRESHKRNPSLTRRTQNRTWVNNGEVAYCVLPIELNNYLSQGFVKGMLPKNRKMPIVGSLGFVWINNGDSENLISPDKLENYLLQGFTYGRLPRIWVCNQEQSCMIKEKDLELYLDKGYIQGRKYNHS